MTFERPLSVEEICSKLRPVFGKRVDEIYFQYTVGDGRDERDEIVHVLNALYQKNLNQLLDKGILLEPPREEQLDGDYNLATISYAKRKLFDFTLREQDWPRHICVTGMSGSGKSSIANELETTEAVKQYYTAMGYRVPCRVIGDLKALVYLVELRSTRFVHPTLVAQMLLMIKSMKELFANEGLMLHQDEEPNRFDVRRGEHDIVMK